MDQISDARKAADDRSLGQIQRVSGRLMQVTDSPPMRLKKPALIQINNIRYRPFINKHKQVTARQSVERSMKIAQIAPLIESVPPRLYGGTERIVSYLTEELVRLGHDVTLFASGDSVTSARLVSCATTALRLDPNMFRSQYLACTWNPWTI